MSGLAAAPPPQPPTSTHASDRVCKFFAAGYCRKGQACPFLHRVRADTKCVPAAETKQQLLHSRRPNVCKFFLAGKCQRGTECSFSHDVGDHCGSGAGSASNTGAEQNCTQTAAEPAYFYGAPGARQSTEDEAKLVAPLNYSKIIREEAKNSRGGRASVSSQKACPYFAAGYCRFGSTCKFHHSEGVRPSLEVQAAVAQSAGIKCNICFDSVLPKRFGLLMGCDCAFCLPCIRNWRSNREEEFARDAVRRCPLCRRDSFFIVPSNRYLSAGTQKSRIVAEYLTQMKRRPCRFFQQGDCQFGNGCFYAHIGPDGREVTVAVPVPRVGATGQSHVARTPMLSEFLR